LGRRKQKRAIWLLDFKQYKNYLKQKERQWKILDPKTTRKAQTPYTLPATHFAKRISPLKMSAKLMKRNTVRCTTSGGGGTSRDKEKAKRSSFWCKKREAVPCFEKYFKIYHTKGNFYQHITTNFVTQLTGEHIATLTENQHRYLDRSRNKMSVYLTNLKYIHAFHFGF
jgi:hypothetical protein